MIFKTFLFSADLYAFAVPENAAVGTTVGRIMADDGDTGINARMTYSLEDDLEESSTFIIKTDPVTQEGVVLLAKVNKNLLIFNFWVSMHFYFLVFSLIFLKEIAQPETIVCVWAERPRGSETLFFTKSLCNSYHC